MFYAGHWVADAAAEQVDHAVLVLGNRGTLTLIGHRVYLSPLSGRRIETQDNPTADQVDGTVADDRS